MKKINDRQFVLDCINAEFSIIGENLYFNTFDELSDWSKENPEWFSKYKFNSENDYNQWKAYYLDHFYDWKPKYITKKQAQKEFEWFDLSYGFSIRK